MASRLRKLYLRKAVFVTWPFGEGMQSNSSQTGLLSSYIRSSKHRLFSILKLFVTFTNPACVGWEMQISRSNGSEVFAFTLRAIMSRTQPNNGIGMLLPKYLFITPMLLACSSVDTYIPTSSVKTKPANQTPKNASLGVFFIFSAMFHASRLSAASM